MAALLIRRGSPAALHEHRGLLGSKIGQQAEVHGGPQVIGVAHEHVLVALREQAVQLATAHQSSIQISMPWRAPLQRSICRVVNRVHAGCIDFRRLVLNEFEIGVLDQRRILPVTAEESHSVIGSGEGVHEHELDVLLLFQVQHLLRQDIQKRHFALHFQERLGLFKAHASPQPSVQLEDHGLLEQLRSRGGTLDVVEAGQGLHRGDGRFRDHTCAPRLQIRIQCQPLLNESVRQARCHHLLLEGIRLGGGLRLHWVIQGGCWDGLGNDRRPAHGGDDEVRVAGRCIAARKHGPRSAPGPQLPPQAA
mmetsp:Transcript_33260/g.81183  ORF Transcript_33260/g.81183 Transcript_33260/m.81183 type:complete len:307 (-) Transcript_33260:52-972(-)